MRDSNVFLYLAPACADEIEDVCEDDQNEDQDQRQGDDPPEENQEADPSQHEEEAGDVAGFVGLVPLTVSVDVEEFPASAVPDWLWG